MNEKLLIVEYLFVDIVYIPLNLEYNERESLR